MQQGSIKRKRVAILISGRGSNMEVLIKACEQKDYPAKIVLVISNRPNAAGLDFARSHDIPALTLDHNAYGSRPEFEAEMNRALIEARTELVCNAGFMRLLTEEFVEYWRDRQLNIHPSLLPSFKGLNTHERALQRGVKLTGCTVHFIRAQMDTGPIIAQSAVPVLPGDSVETLAARVLEEEHKLYPDALKMVAAGGISVEGNIAKIVS